MATTGKTIYQLTPEAERLAEERGYTASTQQKLPKELFDVLLKEGDLPTLLAEGGRDLTRQQLQQVRELAGKQSKRKLQAMSESLAGSPGYNEFMSLPIIAKILAGGKGKSTKPKTAQKQPTKTKKSPKNKDPEISAVAPKTVVPLKPGDSEADILAKMLNIQTFQREQDKKAYREYDAKKKVLQDEREREFKELMDAFGKNASGGDKPQSQKKVSPGKSKFLKYALLGAAGMFLSKGAFAGEVKDVTDGFGKSIRSVIESIKSVLDINQPTNTEGVILHSENEAAAKKSAEDYLGREITPQEWDELLRTTYAESSSDTAEQANVMATILNRAKWKKYGNNEPGSIIKATRDPKQFEAVTGTDAEPGPSKMFKAGPSKEALSSMFAGATSILPTVSHEQTRFTSINERAYRKPGHNIGYLYKMLREGGKVVGKQIFNAPSVAQLDQTKPEVPELMKKYKPRRSPVVVYNNVNNTKLGDINVLNTTTQESDKSVVIDQQYYRR